MKRPIEIFIDRLGDGKTEKIEETLDAAFIDIKEKDLEFFSSIYIKGETYIAENHLIIKLNINTKASIPCSICNNFNNIPIQINRFYHAEELSKIKNHIYDYSTILREGILLEVPTYVECKGKCPKREKIKKYFSKGKNQFPFADLN